MEFSPIHKLPCSRDMTGSDSAKHKAQCSCNNVTNNKKNPLNYEPQYGGWCAYAMGKDGSKVEVDPETFKIIDGKLYLYYNKFFNNTLKSWNKDETNLKSRADLNWKKFYHQ